MELNGQLILLAILLINTAYLFLTKKNLNEEAKLTEVKKQIYMLFLHAEKQNWVGEEKMAWCVRQVYARFVPEVLRGLIKENSIEEFMKNLYTEFKLFLKTNA